MLRNRKIFGRAFTLAELLVVITVIVVLAAIALPAYTGVQEPSANVTVYKTGSALGGTHNSRKQINAVFADWHSETMPWTVFTNDINQPTDPSASLRWDPYTPYP